MRGPIWWYGGKGNMVRRLRWLIPPHHIYVEVFGGGASLLFDKNPSPVEVYNDVDSGLVNLFRVLRDPEKFQRFHRLVSLTPYSREEYEFCRDKWGSCEDEVERAYRFYVAARMSFSGTFDGGWSRSKGSSWRGMSGAVSLWLSAIDNLPQIAARLMRVQIEHDDFRRIIQNYDSPQTFFYLDPPYIHGTRREIVYKHEMTNRDHEELVSLLLRIQGKAMLSGYRHPIYRTLEDAGWRRLDFKTACYAVGRTRATGILGLGAALERQPRVESVWMSYREQQELPLDLIDEARGWEEDEPEE